MPTYDYECKECGHTFDAFQAMSDDPLVVCPKCAKKGLRRLIGGGLGVIFKGSGFYVTDSRGAKSSASPSSKGESSSSSEGSSSSSSGPSSDSSSSSSSGKNGGTNGKAASKTKAAT